MAGTQRLFRKCEAENLNGRGHSEDLAVDGRMVKGKVIRVLN